MPVEEITGTGVRLRLPNESDADDIAAACADPSTQQFLHQMPNPYTRADALWWINEGVPSAWAAGGTGYVIVDPATDKVIGGTGISRVVAERRQGEVGYWVAPWARRRGVARAATAALADWAFRHGFARLELLTEPANTPSQRVALAAGFRHEGVRRSAGTGRHGDRHDLIAWRRLPGDPPGPIPRVLPDLPGGQLSDGTVTLMPLRSDDIKDVYALHRIADVRAVRVPPEPMDLETTARRCSRAESYWLAGERVDLSIRDAATTTFAGEIGLYYQEPTTGQAMIGYSMLPEWRGKGFAVRSVRLLTGWVFGHTGIGRLIAGTSPGNIGSQAVLGRAGFRREGLLRGRLPGADGSRADDLLYALLPEDLSPTRTPSR
ncbi:MAG TPA: GNAT family protein [Micromonosporaceae bacterium]|nr:GNAT family protein [Micromonosporaceae bacterium]